MAMGAAETGRENMAQEFQLLADDVVMWHGNTSPSEAQIDRSATTANARGWNGTQLDVYYDGEWVESVSPSEEVLA
jgi:hypothetical protein